MPRKKNPFRGKKGEKSVLGSSPLAKPPFNLMEFRKELERKGQLPKALEEMNNELHRKRELAAVHELTDAKRNVYGYFTAEIRFSRTREELNGVKHDIVRSTLPPLVQDHLFRLIESRRDKL